MRTRVAMALSLAVLSFGSLAFPHLAEAQSGLEQVEQFTRLGRTEDARSALMTWWNEERSDASRRELQRGLWLRGRLTVDPIQAKLDFRRLAVMYPSGQFTADAILRLAQASWAMGDDRGAREHVAMLVRDYPRSDARDQAEAWLVDAGPVPPAGDTPTRTLPPPTESDSASDSAAAGEGEDSGRDAPPSDGAGVGAAGAAAAGADTAGAAPAAQGEATVAEQGADEDARESVEGSGADEADEGAEPVVNYYVQLGAFAEEERAFALHDEVKAAGVDVRVVRVEGSRFTHVRVGRFAERAAAVDLLEELAAQGISAALVRDDRPEEQVRD